MSADGGDFVAGQVEIQHADPDATLASSACRNARQAGGFTQNHMAAKTASCNRVHEEGIVGRGSPPSPEASPRIERAMGCAPRGRFAGKNRPPTEADFAATGWGFLIVVLKLSVEPMKAVIDSGLKGSEVYRFCLATGWKPMKGDDAE